MISAWTACIIGKGCLRMQSVHTNVRVIYWFRSDSTWTCCSRDDEDSVSVQVQIQRASIN